MSDMMSVDGMLDRLRADAADEEFEGAQLGPIAVRELLRHIDALESNKWRLLCRIHSSRVDAMRAERDELAARLAEIEAQEPSMYVLRSTAGSVRPTVVTRTSLLSCAQADRVDAGEDHLDPLFARPAPRQRVSRADELAHAAAPERAGPVQGPVWLTDERIAQIAAQTWGSAGIAPQSAAAFARAIEAWMLGASSPWSAAPERAADLGENIIEAQRAQIRTLTAERDAAQVELAQARGVLQNMEWDSWGYDRFGEGRAHCPCCGCTKDEGHAPDCALSAVLAAKGE